MSSDSVPESLRRAVEGDLHPVRPLHPAWLRIMLIIAVTAVVLAFVLAKASLRTDLDQLPMWLSWGCSALQFSLGLLLLALALREAVPGGGVPGGAVRLAAATALIVQVLIGIATSIYSPAITAADGGVAAGIGCFKHETMMASLSHVLVWHTGAVIAFMTLGWCAGLLWQHHRWNNGS